MNDTIKNRKVRALNKQALHCMIDDEEIFLHVIRNAFSQVVECLDDELEENDDDNFDDDDYCYSFLDFIGDFWLEFNMMAAEIVAHNVLNMDLNIYYDSVSPNIYCSDVQALINGEKQVDPNWLKAKSHVRNKNEAAERKIIHVDLDQQQSIIK